MKLSKSLKISNFADDNELLIHSPYWTSLVTCESVILTVISRPMFNLETLAPSLPILVFKLIFAYPFGLHMNIFSTHLAASLYFVVLKISFDLTFEST